MLPKGDNMSKELNKKIISVIICLTFLATLPVLNAKIINKNPIFSQNKEKIKLN